jgi:hypothetical protein
MLALVYTLLGRFSDGLLGVRLLETAIGAVFGGIAAILILPTRTRDVVQAKAYEVLDAAAALVHTSIARIAGAADASEPLDAARVLEEHVQQFIVRAKPAIGSPVLIGTGHELRRWIVALSATSYYGRMLARIADRAPELHDGALAALLDRVEQTISGNIRAAQERIYGRHDVATTSTFALFDQLRRGAPEHSAEHAALTSAAHLLERLDRTIARLAREEGTIVEPAAPPPGLWVATTGAAVDSGERNSVL